MNEQNKLWIDGATYEQLLYKWRNAPFGDEMFQGDACDYYSKVMSVKKLTADHVQASKNVGWGNEPEQEPVAWSYEYWRSGITGQPQWFDEVKFVQPPSNDPSNDESFRNIVPLYTSPPHRKPLTHEQVDTMSEEGVFLGSVYEITRAIEAAHLIT